jgi:hypothetical protein
MNKNYNFYTIETGGGDNRTSSKQDMNASLPVSPHLLKLEKLQTRTQLVWIGYECVITHLAPSFKIGKTPNSNSISLDFSVKVEDIF